MGACPWRVPEEAAAARLREGSPVALPAEEAWEADGHPLLTHIDIASAADGAFEVAVARATKVDKKPDNKP